MEQETPDLNRPLPGRKYYLAMWHMFGFESLVDIGDMWAEEVAAEKAHVWALLSDPNARFKPKTMQTINQMVSSMKLRARVNSQRHYEIYMFMTDDDIPKSVLDGMIDEDPQGLVDLIRAKGIKLYGETIQSNQPVIR